MACSWELMIDQPISLVLHLLAHWRVASEEVAVTVIKATDSSIVQSTSSGVSLAVAGMVIIFDPIHARAIGQQLLGAADDADRDAAIKWRQLKRDLA